MPSIPTTAELLGYPQGTRLLILNIDDYGMCFTVNRTGLDILKKGLASSCTVMVPCPWGINALRMLKENPAIPFGVHLTAISEHAAYRWRPLSSPEKIPSLVDKDGFFPLEPYRDEMIRRANCDEVEREFRAQIEAVLSKGMQPTHLDSHCNTHDLRDDIFEMTVHLGREYGLALRVHQPRFMPFLRQRGLLTIDHPDLDSFDLPTRGKSQKYIDLLRNLPPGLSEWAIHPARASAELRTITPSWPIRKADYDFFSSAQAQKVIAEEGIQIVSYRLLQPFWK